MYLPASLPDSVDWSQPVNWSHPLNRGLRAWWLAAPRFRGGVVWRDLCGLHHGTLTSMAPATAWQGTSRPGGWGQLDLVAASSQYVLHSAALVTEYPFTVSAWCQPDALSGVLWSEMRDNTNSWYGHYLDFTGSAVRAISVVNNTFRVASSAAAATAGQWHMVTGVFASATSRRVYLDAVPGAENTESSSPAGMANTVVSGSKRSTHDNFFDGRVESVQVWRGRALSATEVSSLYHLSRQHYPGLLNRVSMPVYVPQAAGGTILPFMQHLCMGRAE